MGIFTTAAQVARSLDGAKIEYQREVFKRDFWGERFIFKDRHTATKAERYTGLIACRFHDKWCIEVF